MTDNTQLPTPLIPATIPLAPIHQRDLTAVTAQQQQLQAQKASTESKLSELFARVQLIARAIIGAHGIDTDELRKAGYALEIADDLSQILIHPPAPITSDDIKAVSVLPPAEMPAETPPSTE